MKHHPTVKTQNFNSAEGDEFFIKKITITSSSVIDTLRIYVNKTQDRLAVKELFIENDIKSHFDSHEKCVYVSVCAENNICRAINVMEKDFYISSKFADELCHAFKSMKNNSLFSTNSLLTTTTLLSKFTLLPKIKEKNLVKLNFRQHDRNFDQNEMMVGLLRKRIQKLTPLQPRYYYEGENSINPAYTDIESSSYLCPDEKRIFVLRSDFILATGIKNVCINLGNTDILKKIDPIFSSYINKNDRYGHPSLAQPNETFDGSVYYAGWLCQRQNNIQVFLQSGRFHNPNLTELDKMDIELYIAYQFMKYYGKQDIIFYDCDENEKLDLFLSDHLPKEKTRRVYTPVMLDQVLSYENYNELIKYEKNMISVKLNLKLSLNRILSDSELINDIKPDVISNIHNLSSYKRKIFSNSLCFNDFWNNIKKSFDISMYHSYNKQAIELATNQFQHALKTLINAGIPFVNGRKIVIWTTRFARNEAERFAKKNDAVTDGMAQKYIRNILLGWPDGKLNVFYELVKTPNPLFPIMATVFWNAMSEMFILEMNVGDEVHLFYQDSLTVGNFCWDVELPAIRNKNGKIILHQYDIKTNLWKAPINMDSIEGKNVYLRRRSLHLFDLNTSDLDPKKIKIESGVSIWKQEFKDNDMTKDLIKWHSPKKLTLGKFKSIVQLWKSVCNKDSSNRSHPDESVISNESDCVINSSNSMKNLA